MDSRLLNAFHDDPFDGNYVKYDTGTQFWSTDSETLGLQLTETLHGILPIAPTEVVSTNIYNTSILKDDDYCLESNRDLNTNSIIYGDYHDETPIGMINKRKLSSQQAIEIVTVDPNDDYDSEFSESTDNEELNHHHEVVAYNDIRSCSRSTFRSRTDSSSIGDYESHSSDYDDESDAEGSVDLNTFQNKNSTLLQQKQVDNIALYSDGVELKKAVEDVDAFGIQLDAGTFDLATFITQDDQVFENHSSVTKVHGRMNLGEVIVSSKNSESDSDSDVIVDVETVEVGEEVCIQTRDNDIAYMDNMKSDPSWSPNKQRNEKKEPKQMEPNFTKHLTLVPNKRQTNLLKRKFGIGRGKNISMHRNPAKIGPKSDIKCKPQQNNNNVELKSKNCVDETKETVPDQKIENMLIKKDAPPATIKDVKPNQLDPRQQLIDKKGVKLFKDESIPKNVEPTESLEVIFAEVPSQQQVLPLKRKLNIEEYKKRRENPSTFTPISNDIQTVDKMKIPKTDASIQTTIPMTTCAPQSKFQVNKPPQSTEVTSIVKSLKESQGLKRFVDPITEAKNKVLRLQELKKAQQIKIIDSTVSSKVGRVTKILPLKDIVNDAYKTKEGNDNSSHVISNQEYEEIIIVSTGCNTDITIPPDGYSLVQPKVGKNLSRSLLKSSVLLANISNSFQKVRSDESVKISNNSLLVSIQDVVVKQTGPLNTNSLKAPQRSFSTSEHGEDKVIMHLRKDRIRKRMVSQSMQTELLPEFPVLPAPQTESIGSYDSSNGRSKKGRRRKYRPRQHSYSSDEECRDYRARSRSSSRSLGKRSRRHRSSVSSSYSESDDYTKRGRRYSVSSDDSRDCSLSSNDRRSRSKVFDRAYRNSRSRSKSSSRSRSRSRRGDASRHVERNVSAPAVEERRIVYVGRIEQDTTKEMLRKKFIGYGPIKQITIHYKDTGMKYGFVTYEKSEDAFRVIDGGTKDTTINMYDISFGGRRAFCRSSYADLDNAGINTYQSYVVPRPVAPPKEEDSFEALLLKVKAKLNATKASSSNTKI